MARLFVVDDNEDLLISIRFWCEKKGYDVNTYSTAGNIINDALELRPDMILLDINLKGKKDGSTLCRELKQELPFAVKIILFSADPLALLNYQVHDADGILNKPFEFDDLENKLRQHLRKVK